MSLLRPAVRRGVVCAFFFLFCNIGLKPLLAARPTHNTGIHYAQGVMVTLWQEGSVLLEGEPLVVHYRVANDSDETQRVVLNTKEQNWLSVHLFGNSSYEDSDAMRHPVSLQSSEVLSDLQRKTSGQRSSINELYIGPHSDSEGLYVLRLNGETAMPIPAGQYRLLLRGNLPVNSGDDPTKKYIDRRNWAFRFTVKPFDATASESKVKALQQTARNGDGVEASNAMEILTAFPSKYAHAAWVELAKDKKLSPAKKGEFVNGLVLSHSSDAVQFLGEMTWKLKVLDCKGILSGLHFYGDAATKKQIENLFTTNGDKLPSVPHINVG